MCKSIGKRRVEKGIGMAMADYCPHPPRERERGEQCFQPPQEGETTVTHMGPGKGGVRVCAGWGKRVGYAAGAQAKTEHVSSTVCFQEAGMSKQQCTHMQCMQCRNAVCACTHTAA